MKTILFLTLSTFCFSYAQTILEADGPGNTYELINSVFAPGYNAVENPECIHPEFGRHIAEVWDSTLSKHVFEFYIHVTPDNDRCINTDRQRMEIKTYDSSPAYLKGVSGETITYKWRFKLPVGFKPSSSFTHIHQIKAVGGDDGNPIFTLTPRKGSPNKMELIHDNKYRVTIVNLSLFEGVWVECMEVIKVGTAGTYSMTINRVSDGTTLLAYSSGNIMTMRPDNTFIRPKWGIYRSLNSPGDLRDEAVRFADFSIQEGLTDIESADISEPVNFYLEQNYPNPFNPTTTIKYSVAFLESRHPESLSKISIKVYNLLGNEIKTLVNEIKSPGNYEVVFNGIGIPSGVYFYKIQSGNYTQTKKMILMK